MRANQGHLKEVLYRTGVCKTNKGRSEDTLAGLQRMQKRFGFDLGLSWIRRYLHANANWLRFKSAAIQPPNKAARFVRPSAPSFSAKFRLKFRPYSGRRVVYQQTMCLIWLASTGCAWLASQISKLISNPLSAAI